MTRSFLMITCLLATWSISPALAGNGKAKAGGQAQSAAAKECPPGLAKKSPACVPPGLARKADRRAFRYERGDRIAENYVIFRDYDRYGLDRRHTYLRVGDLLYRVDPRTREVLDVIGAVARLLD